MHTFEDIIGYEYHKQELKIICDVLKYPEKYKSMGARPPHAIMEARTWKDSDGKDAYRRKWEKVLQL